MSLNIELSNQEQVTLCSLRDNEWRVSKFFGDDIKSLAQKGLAETRMQDGLVAGKLNEEGAILAKQLRKKRGHRGR